MSEITITITEEKFLLLVMSQDLHLHHHQEWLLGAGLDELAYHASQPMWSIPSIANCSMAFHTMHTPHPLTTASLGIH